MRIQLIEPFFGGSHRAWAEGWCAHSGHDVELLTMEATNWRRRMRGAAISLAQPLIERSRARGRPDAIVCSDMIDLAALLALTRRELGDVPVALYLHENQLTYPRQPGEALDQGLAWITWGNLLAADAIWCNSAFHRDELRRALPAFLSAAADPDHIDRAAEVSSRMEVLPVGVDLSHGVGRSPRAVQEDPLIVSNQRWHHDKDLGAVARALVGLADEGLAFRVAFVGDDRGGEAGVIHPLLDRLGDRVVARGELPRADYLTLLQQTDIVVSAARNEFFGIAVVEAVAAGAVPVLPDGLAYRETIPAEFHDLALYRPGDLRPALRRALALQGDGGVRASTDELANSMRRFDWSVVAPTYDAACDALVAGGPGTAR